MNSNPISNNKPVHRQEQVGRRGGRLKSTEVFMAAHFSSSQLVASSRTLLNFLLLGKKTQRSLLRLLLWSSVSLLMAKCSSEMNDYCSVCLFMSAPLWVFGYWGCHCCCRSRTPEKVFPIVVACLMSVGNSEWWRQVVSLSFVRLDVQRVGQGGRLFQLNDWMATGGIHSLPPKKNYYRETDGQRNIRVLCHITEIKTNKTLKFKRNSWSEVIVW